MLCARVVRGISSTENDVTPRSATSRIVSIDPSGRRKPISTWSGRKQGKIVLAGPVVRAMTEHLDDDVGRARRPRRGRAGSWRPWRCSRRRESRPRRRPPLPRRPRSRPSTRIGITAGNQRHAPLAREALSRDSDDHETGSDREDPGARARKTSSSCLPNRIVYRPFRKSIRRPLRRAAHSHGEEKPGPPNTPKCCGSDRILLCQLSLSGIGGIIGRQDARDASPYRSRS